MAGAGLPVPRGFVVCTAAFQSFLERHGGERISCVALTGRARRARHDGAQRRVGRVPRDHRRESAARRVARRDSRGVSGLGAQTPVAVRSSAVSEDGEAASFAGQQETFLNVRGDEAVARDVRECWASFFAPRALFYRAQKGTLSDTRMAVVVQEMVLAEKSGVLFTIDPIRKRRDHMVIEAVFGLGEGVVSGMITPDHLRGRPGDRGRRGRVHLGAVERGSARRRPRRDTARRALRGRGRRTGARQSRSSQNLRTTGLRVEAFLGGPQDIEWSFRGGELLLLQSRPITTL